MAPKILRGSAFLVPGFQGLASQPLLVRFDVALTAMGFQCTRLQPPRLSLQKDLEAYVHWTRDQIAGPGEELVLIGRSFGGRVLLRLAVEKRVRALVLLGFPLRPPQKRRVSDEQALSQVRCPTLIVQGTHDELGPMDVVRAASADNPNVSICELPGVGHTFGRLERTAVEETVSWLDRVCCSG